MPEIRETVTIGPRFCGPPDSANGGYTCGLTAHALGVQPTEVTLHHPPPLNRVLQVRRHAEGVELLDGQTVVCAGRPAQLHIDLPPRIPFTEAVEAAAKFDVAAYAARHPFPTCYTCGPSRPDGDGLALFPAPIRDRDHLVAWPWIPDRFAADRDGLVGAPILWAALDCPSGLAWLDDGPSQPAVLGRMTAVVHHRPRVDEQLVVAGWRIGAPGRKLESGSVVWSSDGGVAAANLAIWIRLTDEQRKTFGIAR